MAVPTIFLNGETFGQGRMELEQILARLDTGAEAKAAEKMTAKDAFDVLVVGGGPAGAAAAIYAARKGIRTRSEEHTSELQSLMRISYAVFCLKKKNKKNK